MSSHITHLTAGPNSLTLLLVPYPSLFSPGPIPHSLFSAQPLPINFTLHARPISLYCSSPFFHCPSHFSLLFVSFFPLPGPFIFTVRLLFSIARPILLTSLIVPTRSLLAHPFLLTSLLVPFHSLYYSSYHTHCTPRPISISFFLSLNS